LDSTALFEKKKKKASAFSLKTLKIKKFNFLKKNNKKTFFLI